MVVPDEMANIQAQNVCRCLGLRWLHRLREGKVVQDQLEPGDRALCNIELLKLRCVGSVAVGVDHASLVII